MSPPPEVGAAVARAPVLPSGRPDPAVPAAAPTAVPARRGGLLRRRFLRSRLGVLGLALLALLMVGAFVAPLLYPWDHRALDDLAVLTPPSAAHWFGTGKLGEDLFAQSMHGLQKSLVIGLLVAVLSTALATVVGTVAGYLGGATGRWRCGRPTCCSCSPASW